MDHLGGCHALGSVVSMVSEHAGQVSRGPVSWSVMVSDHERQGLKLGSWSPNISDHDNERNGAGRVSRGSGPW